MIHRTIQTALAFLSVPAVLLLMPLPGLAEPVGSQVAPLQIAQGEPTPRKQWQDPHAQMVQQLNLSPEQAQKVQAVMQQGKTQSHALYQQIKAKRRALMQYLQSPNATEAQARSLNGEINELQKRLSELRLKTWFTMRSYLNSEQLQSLERLKPSSGSVENGPPHGRSGR